MCQSEVDMSTQRLLFQLASTLKIQLSMLSSTNWTSSSHQNVTCSGLEIAEK